MPKGKGYGHPGSSGLAQSGGINRSFGGGKGGTKNSKPVTQGRKVGSGTLNNGLQYNVRSAGGDASMTPFTGRVGQTPPARGGAAKTKKPTVRKPFKSGSS